MPNQKKRTNSNILKLKIAKEEIDIVNFELDTGSIDLAEILSKIRLRIPDSQRSKYDMFFFGKSQEKTESIDKLVSNETSIVVSTNKNNIDADSNKQSTCLQDPWLKKLYKQIVKRSHPDKYIDFPIQAIKEKFINVYMDATKALSENNHGLMILCAYEVEIVINNSDMKKYIDDAIKKYTSEIASIKNLIGYQWYHIQEDERTYFIEAYLKSMGYEVDKKDTEEIIDSRPPLARKRKPGTRPVKNAIFKK